jgi:hypothetical protein
MKGCVGQLFRSVPRVEFNQRRGCDKLDHGPAAINNKKTVFQSDDAPCANRQQDPKNKHNNHETNLADRINEMQTNYSKIND